MIFHVNTFQIDVDSHLSTFWHKLVPKTRVLFALLFVFATSFTPNGHWWTWGMYSLGLSIIIIISRVRLAVLIKRVVLEASFVSVVLLGTLFREGGQILWQWGWFRVTTEGLTVLGSVSFKAILCLFMLNVLTLTTSITDLLQALAALKMPPLLIAIFNSMYRYLGVLIDEFETMRRAAMSRNLMINRRWQRIIIGNMIGSLFIRTYERGERIYQAMLARGYTGLLPVSQVPQGNYTDLAALIALILLISLGQGIYFIFLQL